jgi:aldehyde dehydrogenase (NAD+)
LACDDGNMVSEDEETTVAALPHIVKDLQRTVRSGITRTAEWRMQQLRAILKLVQENEERIIQVIAQDIGKPAHEAFLTEIFVATASCKLAIKELKKWMAPQKVPITLIAFPGTAEVIPEPLGVALIISPWNFPFLLAIDPIIGALAAGCAVVLKPSEITPTVSSLLAELIPQYLDTDAIRVVEGGVPVVTALLEQKWDKIFYTGSPRVGRIVMAAAAKHLTPVTLELGGKCPVYIDDSVDLKV